MEVKIISVRRGFLADHSSTSYEFLAIDKPLDSIERAEIARLSSRASPTSRRVSFVYDAEGYDIPGGWYTLMHDYYDVMYTESYDWWTLAVAFNTNDQGLITKLSRYEFEGLDGLGVFVSHKRGRVVVSISCHLAAEATIRREDIDPYLRYDYGEDEPDDDVAVTTDDYLLEMLTELRLCLQRGECESLYAVWEKYGFGDEDDDEAPPKPKGAASDARVTAWLGEMLVSH